jgi:hypothetical protein
MEIPFIIAIIITIVTIILKTIDANLDVVKKNHLKKRKNPP